MLDYAFAVLTLERSASNKILVPMHVLREWAGHSDIATTATYYLGVGDGMADRARKALAATA